LTKRGGRCFSGSLPLAGTSRAHPIPNGFGQDKAAQFAGISEDSILANFMKQRVLYEKYKQWLQPD
jgi:hypothetical protein